MVLPVGQCKGNVLLLSAFVTSKKEQNQGIPLNAVINPVAGTMINPHFPYTIAHMLFVSQVSEPCPVQAHTNLCSSSGITKTFQPLLEGLSPPFGSVIIYFITICLHDGQ